MAECTKKADGSWSCPAPVFTHGRVGNIEKTGDGGVRIEGYGATPGVKPDGMDLALDAMRSALDPFMANPKPVLWMHNLSIPIGRIEEARVDEKGLYFRDYISDATEESRKVQALIQDGIVRHFSLGWHTTRAESIEGEPPFPWLEDGGTKVTGMMIQEHSVVSVPMDDDASFGLARAMAEGSDARLCKRLLDPFALDGQDDREKAAARIRRALRGSLSRSEIESLERSLGLDPARVRVTEKALEPEPAAEPVEAEEKEDAAETAAAIIRALRGDDDVVPDTGEELAERLLADYGRGRARTLADHAAAQARTQDKEAEVVATLRDATRLLRGDAE